MTLTLTLTPETKPSPETEPDNPNCYPYPNHNPGANSNPNSNPYARHHLVDALQLPPVAPAGESNPDPTPSLHTNPSHSNPIQLYPPLTSCQPIANPQVSSLTEPPEKPYPKQSLEQHLKPPPTPIPPKAQPQPRLNPRPDLPYTCPKSRRVPSRTAGWWSRCSRRPRRSTSTPGTARRRSPRRRPRREGRDEARGDEGASRETRAGNHMEFGTSRDRVWSTSCTTTV